MQKNITELYCFADDFCYTVDANYADKPLTRDKKRTRIPGITISEILTIILLYHQFQRSTIRNGF